MGHLIWHTNCTLITHYRPGSAVSVTSGETSTDSHTDTQFLMSSDSGKLAADRSAGPPDRAAPDRPGGAPDRSGGRGRAYSLGSHAQAHQAAVGAQALG